MAKNPITCGGFDIDSNTLRIVKKDGRPTLEVIGGVTVGSGEVDLSVYVRKDEDNTLEGDLNLNGNSVKGALEVSTNGPAPLYIGSTIKPSGTTGARITGLVGSAGIAIVKPDTVDEYEPITIADPTSANHAATKRYVDESFNSKFAQAIEDYLNSAEGQAKIRSIIGG